MDLSSKKCVSCQGGIPSLSGEEIQKYLAEISDWEVLENKKIKKEFKFKDFKEAIIFVNKVAEIAEQEDHHPDIYIDYNKVILELWTHKIGGLHENDFILASKINKIIN